MMHHPLDSAARRMILWRAPGCSSGCSGARKDTEAGPGLQRWWLPGSFFPQSLALIVWCLGGSLLGSIMAVIMYISQIQCYKDEWNKLFQTALLALGLNTCLGIALVAISEIISLPLLHTAGVGLAFILGAFYNLFQTLCLYETSCSPRIICHIRMALSITVTIMMLIFYVNFTQQRFSLCHDPEREEAFDDAAKVAWWVAIFCFQLQVVTYYMDFQRLYIEISAGKVNIGFRKKLHQDIL